MVSFFEYIYCRFYFWHLKLSKRNAFCDGGASGFLPILISVYPVSFALFVSLILDNDYIFMIGLFIGFVFYMILCLVFTKKHKKIIELYKVERNKDFFLSLFVILTLVLPYLVVTLAEYIKKT